MNNKANRIKLNRKWLSVLLTICMVISLIPATVMADQGKASAPPLGASPAEGSEAEVQSTNDSNSRAIATPCYDSVDEAAAFLRSEMVNRVSVVEVEYDMGEGFSGTLDDLRSVRTAIFDKAIEHTGNGKEGDYIYFNMSSYERSMSYNPNDLRYATFIYTLTFRTTAEDESIVDQEVAQLIASLNLSGKSNYDKFTTIYDYVCDHVTYDTQGLAEHVDGYIYTAYAALTRGKAVCQGYATLLYRLLCEAGVPARVVAGCTDNSSEEQAKKTAHAWNIVKIGDYYYNVDSTWDSNKYEYSPNGVTSEYRHLMNWRLRCDANFPQHIPEQSWSSYNKSSQDYPDPFFSGHAITLADQIGVKFYVYVPENMNMDNAYIDFKLSNGREIGGVDWDSGSLIYNNYPIYSFTCPINALEVADTITATLHFGNDGATVVNKYTAQEYCMYIEANSDQYDPTVVDLANAIRNYGYYLRAQQLTSDGWTDKRNHADIVKVKDYVQADRDRISSDVSNYSATIVDRSTIAQVAYSLTLNAKTKINLYYKFQFQLSSCPSGFTEVTMNNGETWYYISFSDIRPFEYKKPCGISQVQVYLVSYVDAVLKGNFSEEKKEAMMAYYEYCDAAYEYYRVRYAS